MSVLREEYYGDYKQCEYCHRPLPAAFQGTLCPACEQQLLFQKVKDYIRENHVNEYEVADHFQIPLRQVKEWIRDGRIEYNLNADGDNLTGVRCQHCGAPVVFGTLCPKCLKILNRNIRGYEVRELNGDHRMRYLDKDQQKKD